MIRILIDHSQQDSRRVEQEVRIVDLGDIGRVFFGNCPVVKLMKEVLSGSLLQGEFGRHGLPKIGSVRVDKW